jgi:membrane-associated phospholipid phosphatase
MANIDHALLGVNPTVWIEQWAQPLLTDVLYLFYFFYFPMPLIMLGWMYAKGKLQEAEESFFLYLFCYYGAYILYFFIPVEGPRFYLNGLQNVALDGVVLSEPIRRLIDTLEPNKLDAFPSLHAAILTMTMLLTYRHNRKLFHAFIPCAIGITVSLVYLRYHYVIDVIVGFVWAIMSYQFAGKVYRSVRPALVPHFRSVEP